ncbi:MAG: alpha-L-arabinofuranosidase, partial [Prevotella sp.]|nr:alpha-L-arabinofuranosidase [Prevotella sp.]
MNKTNQRLMVACLLMAGVTTVAAQQAEPCVWTVDARRTVTDVAPTMYGVFFEDINFGADGGLYAELVNNRSFEAPL